MITSPSIMVQMADSQWTQSALHLAFAISRQERLNVTLVKFIDVPHVQWLGTSLGHKNFTSTEYEAISAYRATAEDYGVSLDINTMQYVTLFDAVVDAAEHLNAQIVFARLEPSVIPHWHRFQLWRLGQRLNRQGRQFYSLEQPTNADAENWLPSILVSSPRVKQ
jgi:hypothetical protein